MTFVMLIIGVTERTILNLAILKIAVLTMSCGMAHGRLYKLTIQSGGVGSRSFSNELVSNATNVLMVFFPGTQSPKTGFEWAYQKKFVASGVSSRETRVGEDVCFISNRGGSEAHPTLTEGNHADGFAGPSY